MIAEGDAECRELDPRKITSQLGTTTGELMRTLGFDADADGKHQRSRITSDYAERRIRQIIDVLCKVESRFGSAPLAYAWYRSEPLPGFSGLTVMELVQRGRVEDVLTSIDAVNIGIHA